jgi:flagellar export protein FliJ
LDYRAEQLNIIQQKVAEEEQKKFLIQKRIQEFDAIIAQAFTDQQNQLETGILDPAQLQHFPNYIWKLKQSRFQETHALQAQERTLMDMRTILQQALIKKKSLDTLRDKDYAKYLKTIEQAEEEFLAEIALTRAIRKNPAFS